MGKRLAVCISGAVSLGTYEAGVIYEIVNAIGQHNTSPLTPQNEKIEIDVLTGASAGGMTAAIAAQKLLFEYGSFQGEYNNPFYAPWVEEVDLSALLQLGPDEDPACSILSSGLVERISKKYLTARYNPGPPQAPLKHPCASPQMKLGLAMSNLNGIDYVVPVPANRPQTDAFVYTRFQDEFKRPLAAGRPIEDNIGFWEPVRQAAVACGAFPFAFRVQEIQRSRVEFSGDEINFPSTDFRFAYTDGGVFQNEPLGLAKGLVDLIDNHQDTESRFYLYVSPHAKVSVSDANFNAARATLWPTALQLIKGMYHEAQYQDWVRAEQINERIYLFNDRAEGLQQALLAKNITAAQLQPARDSLLQLLYPADGNDVAKNKDRARLKLQFAKEYKELQQAFPDNTADVWIDAILVLETSADLGPVDEMTIYTVTANNDLAGGELLYSFGGFFSKEIRLYDYERGRLNAKKFLRQHAAPAQPNDLGPIRFIDKPDPVLQPVSREIKDLSEELREKLRDQVHDRLNKMMEAAGMSWVTRCTINTFYLGKKLDEIFQL